MSDKSISGLLACWPALRGSILPLALVVMTTLVIGAFTFGFLLLQSLFRTRDLDASTVAYYAADAGVERQLFAVRKENEDVALLAGMSASYSNGSTWQAVGSNFQTTNAKFFPIVRSGDFQFVDLFNPDNLFAASGIVRVAWTWTGPPGCKLEVANAPWDVSQPTVLPAQFDIMEDNDGTGSKSTNPNLAYRFRFRPKGCDVTNLTVNVYNVPLGGTPISFPGDIIVAAQGSSSGTTQAISVTMPRLEILSGVFSYVIFSECTLFKDPSGVAPACP